MNTKNDMPVSMHMRNWMQWLSIRTHLLLLVVVVSVPLVIIVGYGIYNDMRQSVAQTQESLHALANMMVRNTGDKIAHADHVLDLLIARRPKGDPVDSAHCDPRLKDLHSMLPGYTNIGYTDANGDIVCSALALPGGKTINISKAAWYHALQAGKRFTVGPPFIGVISKKWVLVLTKPLWNERQDMVGGINVSLDLNSYDPHIPIQDLPPGSRYGFFSEDGTLIWRNADPDGLIGTRPNSDAARRIVQVRDGAFESVTADGIARVYATAPMPQAGWIAFVTVPANEVYKEAKRRAVSAIALSMGAIVLMVVLALTIARQLEKPVKILEGVARAAHEGDLSRRALVAGPREIASVAQEFNDMLDARVENAEQLEQYRLHLEDLVERRTQALQSSTEQLQQALGNLRHTQDHLVQSEKLAALGSIVAAVSHELNTPLGNCLIVASTLQDHSKRFEKTVASGEALRRSQLEEHLAAVRTSSELLLSGLHRAAELVANFKQVAVDQTSAGRRRFDLKTTVDGVVFLMNASLRKTPYQVLVDIPAGLGMDSYPGAIEQIVSNLINNAVLHGFNGREHGLMRLEASQQGDDVRLVFSDDGLGMSEEVLRHVFDPFFTTRLGQGGSGLGMSICYNLVTGPLGGTVTVASQPGQGTTFTFVLPAVVG